MIDAEGRIVFNASLKSIQLADAMIHAQATVLRVGHRPTPKVGIERIVVVGIELRKKTLEQIITRTFGWRDAAELVGRIPQSA